MAFFRLPRGRYEFARTSEREARLLHVAAAQPPDPSKPEKREQPGGGMSSPAVSPVEQLRLGFERKIAGAAPLSFDSVHDQRGILEVLEESGTLNESAQKVLDAFRESKASPESAPVSPAIDATMAHLSAKELIEAAYAIEGKRSRYEELLQRTERDRKRIEELGCDPRKMEYVLQVISRFQGEGVPLESAFSSIHTEPLDILERIGIPHTLDFSEEQRRHVFQMLVDITQATRIRRSFGQPPGGEEIGEKARNEARDRFLADLEETERTLRQHLDSRINERAAELLEETYGAWKALNPDTFRAYGLTADGVEDAFRDILVTLHGIRRDDGYPSPRTAADSDTFLAEAISALTRLNDVQQRLRKTTGHELIDGGDDEKVLEEEADRWADATTATLRDIDLGTVESGDVREVFESLRGLLAPWIEGRTPTPDERASIRQTSRQEQRRITSILQMFRVNASVLKGYNPEEAEQLLDTLDTHDPKTHQIQGETLVKLQATLSAILGRIERLNDPICSLLGLDQQLRDRKKSIMLHVAGGRIEKVRKEIRCLENCIKHLDLIINEDPDLVVRIPTKQEFLKIISKDDKLTLAPDSENSLGYYDYNSGKFYLNMQVIHESGQDEKAVIAHERGHAITDAFRRFDVFPNLCLDLWVMLEKREKNTEQNLMALLLKNAERWKVPIENHAKLTKEDRWRLMDELMRRTAGWQQKGHPASAHPDDRPLYEAAEHLMQPNVEEEQPLHLTGGVFMAGDEGGEVGDILQESTATESQQPAEAATVDQVMTVLHRDILHTEAFLEAYPSIEEIGDTRAFLNERFGYQELLDIVRNRLEPAFREGTVETPEFKEGLKWVRKSMEEIAKFMGDVDRTMADLSTVRRAGFQSLSQTLLRDINWVSFFDIVAMFRDMKEDILRMWKRRGESARNKLGKVLTNLVPDKVLYLGRLKHEFERRERQSEEEEVSVWEKGLEKIDSHVLIHDMIPRVRTPEHLKAIINLLTKRGRMDWEDTGIWSKLQYFSGYRMPEKPCKRSTVLRNQWLQKMIAAVWRDKDLFEHWKTENDGAVSKGKDGFTTYVDGLSSIKNEAAELKKLLIRHEKIKSGEIVATAEEEVNPHLYEEILHYAMRNGKMTMEGKFFYLIKGVEAGILSLDRLRAFPGQTMKILSIFPFIDFFTRNHNTHHEIREIAAQITDRPPFGDPYSPGPRMTRFLYEQVAFDEEVKVRTNKVLKNAQTIDHEDIPLTVALIDVQGIDNMVNVFSGSQWKLSSQAMENGYVGYNTFFQYLRLKLKAGKPLTQRDRQRLCTVLGAYVSYDNILTQFTNKAKANRPFLSWEELRSDVPVSGEFTTIEYRNAASRFAYTLTQELGIDTIDGVQMKDFIGPERNEASYDAIRKDENENTFHARWYAIPEKLVTALLQKIAQKPGALVQALERSNFLPENNKFTDTNVKEIFDDTSRLQPLQREMFGPSAPHVAQGA